MTHSSTTTDPPVEIQTVASPSDDVSYRFLGQQLAGSSSQWVTHNHEDEFVLPGGRCSACRWTSVDIYRAATRIDGQPFNDEPATSGPLGKYLVVTSGQTIVPGEQTFVRCVWTNSPYEVFEVLTQRKNGRVSLPGPAARALSQAAEYDDGINDAYVNRAVA